MLMTWALLQAGLPTPEVSRLDNGLQIVVVPDGRERLVSVQLWFRAGAVDDAEHAPGLCATIRQRLESAVEIPVALRSGDVRFAGRTLPDACYFAWFVPQGIMDEALRIEAKRLAIRNGEWDIESTEFLQRWFIPGNATLLVTGDVQTATVQEGVSRYFGDLPWAEPPRRASRPAPQAERVWLPAVPAERAGLDVTWVTPGAAEPEYAALAVLMHRLCNAVDGPLSHRLTELGGLSPRWQQEAGRLESRVTLSMDNDDETPAGLEAALDDELKRATREVPTEVELDRARALAARAVRLSQASFADRALRLGFYEVVAGDVQLADGELPRVMRVTVEDLQRAAVALGQTRTVYQPRVAGASESTPIPVAIEAMDRGPAGARQMVCDGLYVTVCTQPAAPFVEVRTLAGGTTGLMEALVVLTSIGAARHSAEQIRDYLTYHGLDLFPLVEGTRPALLSRGPTTHLAQMIELQAELLQPVLHALPTRTIDIVVTGDLDERAACDAARAAWSAAPSP